jgi:hypothetical protein
MSVANFPSSMNIANSKKSCVTDCHASFQRIRSDNSEVNANDIIRIEIPCGRKGDWLHPQDSFLEFKTKLTYTGGTSATGGTAEPVSLDGNAMSLFSGLRIYHGTNLLVNQRMCNRLWQALYDVQCNSAERVSDQIGLGVHVDGSSSVSNNLFGMTLISGNTYQFAFSIPCSVLGSLTDHAIPLGWMGSSSLYLELDVEKPNVAFTTRIPSTGTYGDVGACTAPPVYTELTISEIYYNAKISQLGAEYDNLLLSTFQGMPIRIPSIEYKGEFRNASGTAFSDKFSFQYGSVNNILFWLTNQSTANGNAYLTNNYNSAITQRSMGKMKDFYLTLNGSQFPTQPISCALNNKPAFVDSQNGAVAYQHLLRCFNQNTDVSAGGIMDHALYAFNLTSQASDIITKRSVLGISMDRVDGNNEKYMSGMNTIGSNFVLNCTWESPLASDHFLYAFICHDVAYELVDGLMSVVA